MSELVLHIGTAKTGTTAIQKFLLFNCKLLCEQHTLFPVFEIPVSVARNGFFSLNHAIVDAGLPFPNPLDPAVHESNLKVLTQALASDEKVILSDEGFWYARFAGLRGDLHAKREAYWRHFGTMARRYGASSINVIVYLRRQDLFAASAWKQQVVAGYAPKGPVESFSPGNGKIGLDYADALDAIEKGLGGDTRISVRRYDFARFTGGDIFHDFADAAGLAWSDTFATPAEDVNASLSFDAAEALRRVLEQMPEAKRQYRHALSRYALAHSRKHPDPPGMTPFTKEEAQALVEPYLEGNEQIALRYLDGEPLFSYEHGDAPVWQQDEDAIMRAYRPLRRYAKRVTRLPWLFAPRSPVQKRIVALKRVLKRALGR